MHKELAHYVQKSLKRKKELSTIKSRLSSAGLSEKEAEETIKNALDLEYIQGDPYFEAIHNQLVSRQKAPKPIVQHKKSFNYKRFFKILGLILLAGEVIVGVGSYIIADTFFGLLVFPFLLLLAILGCLILSPLILLNAYLYYLIFDMVVLRKVSYKDCIKVSIIGTPLMYIPLISLIYFYILFRHVFKIRSWSKFFMALMIMGIAEFLIRILIFFPIANIIVKILQNGP